MGIHQAIRDALNSSKKNVGTVPRKFLARAMEMVQISRELVDGIGADLDDTRADRINLVLAGIGKALKSPHSEASFSDAEAEIAQYYQEFHSEMKKKVSSRITAAIGHDFSAKRRLDVLRSNGNEHKVSKRTFTLNVTIGRQGLTAEAIHKSTEIVSGLQLYYLLWLLLEDGRVSLTENPFFYRSSDFGSYQDDILYEPLRFDTLVKNSLGDRENLNVLTDRTHLRISHCTGHKSYGNIWKILSKQSTFKLILKDLSGVLSTAERVRKDLGLKNQDQVKSKREDGGSWGEWGSWSDELLKIAGDTGSGRSGTKYFIESPEMFTDIPAPAAPPLQAINNHSHPTAISMPEPDTTVAMLEPISSTLADAQNSIQTLLVPKPNLAWAGSHQRQETTQPEYALVDHSRHTQDEEYEDNSTVNAKPGKRKGWFRRRMDDIKRVLK